MQPPPDQPRRVTATEARAKLLRSLVTQPKAELKEADREKLDELQLNFIRHLANQK